MTRYSDCHTLDPAVYPYFEIYPKIHTFRPRMEVKSGDDADGRQFKSHIPSGPNVLEGQPWAFGWPSFRPDFPLAPTPPPISTSTSTLAPKSVMAYPVIKICKFPFVWDSVLEPRLIIMPSDPSVYPFFDVYPPVERYIPARYSQLVPQKMPLVTNKESTGTKLGHPVTKICKRSPSHLKLL
jgi:hypothetical protein